MRVLFEFIGAVVVIGLFAYGVIALIHALAKPTIPQPNPEHKSEEK